ncbi:hypothetical protein [Lewinella sp. IMCC34191]|uniref:hypothetical protein n=1 Tax=Lewinella sp. IMCC34191 TaxID=2259172 RepID=UPI000E24D979|nr:hypothetical protein [Lewinella sp. IMCC34191]
MQHLKTLPFLFFALYWSVTVFFNMPDNYLKIQFAGTERFFTTFLYQRWSFFAPPPTASSRLYYDFASADTTEVLSTEVLQPLQEQRRREFILNDHASHRDDILSGSINSFTDRLVDQFAYFKFDQCTSGEADPECHRKFMLDQELHETEQIQALVNYGKMIAQARGDSFTEQYPLLRITISEAPVPKFADRNRTDLPAPAEKIVWYTNWLSAK